jgi:predicted glycoside hydrolase/deacetylase ChbG (UPF0249 family)
MEFEAFQPRTRVLFTADNFGRSPRDNQAVIRAFQQGVLGGASLSGRAGARDNAVSLAKENPGLAVGMQLVLWNGMSALKPSEIHGLVDQRFEFRKGFLDCYLRYLLNPGLRSPLRSEIGAQIRLFRSTGLPMAFVAGRGGFQSHPVVASLLARYQAEWQIPVIRTNYDPLLTNLRLFPLRSLPGLFRGWLMKRSDRWARPRLLASGMVTTDYSLGCLTDRPVGLRYLLRMLEELPPGTYEVCMTPNEDSHAAELEALTSPELRRFLSQPGWERITHADLLPEPPPTGVTDPSVDAARVA